MMNWMLIISIMIMKMVIMMMMMMIKKVRMTIMEAAKVHPHNCIRGSIRRTKVRDVFSRGLKFHKQPQGIDLVEQTDQLHAQ